VARGAFCGIHRLEQPARYARYALYEHALHLPTNRRDKKTLRAADYLTPAFPAARPRGMKRGLHFSAQLNTPQRPTPDLPTDWRHAARTDGAGVLVIRAIVALVWILPLPLIFYLVVSPNCRPFPYAFAVRIFSYSQRGTNYTA